MKILIVGTQRYSINMCDFDLLFRKSKHKIVKVLHHKDTAVKPWFYSGQYSGRSRSDMVTKLTEHPRQSWNGHGDLLKKIYKTDFDYLCLGNGNDHTGEILRKELDCNFLFSEYGWLPWEECFYIDRLGVGGQSEIAKMSINEMPAGKTSPEALESLQQRYNGGKSVIYRDFIYVPLQVDTPLSDGKPDFKFGFTKFKSNAEFLAFLEKMVPKQINILVKNHPANPKPTKIPSRMIDIGKHNLSKYDLYNKMLAMVCINSTSILEAILFGKKVFAYGDDIFSGKGLAYEGVTETSKFMTYLKEKDVASHGDRFLNCLLQRQVNRKQCNDPEYVNSHYWTTSL